jgi:plasmid stabilization system protein ParE
MKIYWSDFASEMLADIYKYYKTNVTVRVANKIKSEILNATNQLKRYPYSGQIELNLEELKKGHRHLIKGNYKIIYMEIFDAAVPDGYPVRVTPDIFHYVVAGGQWAPGIHHPLGLVQGIEVLSFLVHFAAGNPSGTTGLLMWRRAMQPSGTKMQKQEGITGKRH